MGKAVIRYYYSRVLARLTSPLLCFLTGLLVFIAPLHPVLAQADIPDRDRVFELAGKYGEVRVIVKFDVPGIEELTRASAGHQVKRPGLVAPQAAFDADAALASGIAAASDHLINGLKKGTYNVNARYNYIPYIALSVTEQGLLDLEIRSDVLSVALDRPVPLPDPDNGKEDIFNGPGDYTYLIGAENAWDMGYTGSGWYVAVLDTGIRSTHEMFAGKDIVEHCFSTTGTFSGYTCTTTCPNGEDEQDGPGSAFPVTASWAGHGTHVSGIAAGNAATVKGAAIDAGIIAVQVYSFFPVFWDVLSWDSDQVLGLDWVYGMRHTYPIAAVNMSLGGGDYSDYCDGDSRKDAIDNLNAAGIAVTVATGNDGYCDKINSPACVSTAVAVSGSDLSDDAYPGGNWLSGGYVDLIAPAVSVLSAGVWADDSYVTKTGTSMAAPYVAGAWAILKQKQPGASVESILGALQSTAKGVNLEARCPGVGIPGLRIQMDEALDLLPITHTLTVTTQGKGTVVGNPAGIDCGDVCRFDYNEGIPVTLTAKPDADSIFMGWSGGLCSGTEDCLVEMDSDHEVTAVFEPAPITYSLAVLKNGDGNGTVTSIPDGIDCGSECTQHFGEGNQVDLTASPDPGSAFDGWSNPECRGNGPCRVIMNQDAIITATFNPDIDGDGVSDVLENDGPNGGDGNNDGRKDSLQSHVATFPNIDGIWCTLVTPDDTALSNVTTLDNPSPNDAPASLSFPFGFIGFKIEGFPTGDAVKTTMILHRVAPWVTAYYKYGPTPDNPSKHWYEYINVTISHDHNRNQTILDLLFKDGRTGDSDITANGELLDPGAPAGPDIQAGGGGGCGCGNSSFASQGSVGSGSHDLGILAAILAIFVIRIGRRNRKNKAKHKSGQ